jgi:hypothetical protein
MFELVPRSNILLMLEVRLCARKVFASQKSQSKNTPFSGLNSKNGIYILKDVSFLPYQKENFCHPKNILQFAQVELLFLEYK